MGKTRSVVKGLSEPSPSEGYRKEASMEGEGGSDEPHGFLVCDGDVGDSWAAWTGEAGGSKSGECFSD